MLEQGANAQGGARRFNFNTALGVGCVLFSLFLFAVIPYQVEEPPVLFGQSTTSLDPAFFPTLVAVLFLIVGAVYIWLSFDLREHNGFRDLTRENYWNILFTLAVFVLYAMILQPLGFLLSSGVVVAVLSIFYGARHIPSILLVCIGVPAAVYFVFRSLLKVALPELPDF